MDKSSQFIPFDEKDTFGYVLSYIHKVRSAVKRENMVLTKFRVTLSGDFFETVLTLQSPDGVEVEIPVECYQDGAE